MKNGSKILTIVLALVAVAALVFGFVANGQKGTIEADLNKQIEELEGTLKAKTDELTATTEELTALKEEAAKAAEEAAKAAEEAAKAAEEEAAKAAEEAAKAAEEAAKVPEGYPAIIEGLDFGGATVYFYDWWSNDDEEHSTRVADPSDDEKATYAYRDWLEKTYNVKLVQKNLTGAYDTMTTELAEMVKNKNNEVLCTMTIDPNFAAGPMREGLIMPWTIDTTGEEWNKASVDFGTYNGQVLGVLMGADEPREEVFFNKKVLEDAGIDYNELYDLQKSGEWTWDKFEEYMNKVRKDVDNDGVYDIYALTGNPDRVLRGCVYGNGGSFFGSDENGKLIITANSDATLEGLAKRVEWFNEYMAPQSVIAPGSNWDWFEGFWKEGTTAFFVGQNYEGFGSGSPLMTTCDFEWGAVAFPKGPRANDYMYATVTNIDVIPNVYDEETSKKIQQIYYLYHLPTPGVDQETGWIEDRLLKITDDRAIEETLGMLRKGHAVSNKTYLLGDENAVEGPTVFWAIYGATPAEAVDAAMEGWQHQVNVFNGDETQEDYQKYLDDKAAAEAAAAAAAEEAAAAEAAAAEAAAAEEKTEEAPAAEAAPAAEEKKEETPAQ